MVYTIVEDDDREEFKAKVQAHCDQGWKPQGGLVVTGWEYRPPNEGYTEYMWRFFQAMVREES